MFLIFCSIQNKKQIKILQTITFEFSILKHAIIIFLKLISNQQLSNLTS